MTTEPDIQAVRERAELAFRDFCELDGVYPADQSDVVTIDWNDFWCIIERHFAAARLAEPADAGKGLHPSHQTRMSDASTFDEVCVNCGATDQVPGGWGELAKPCPKAAEAGKEPGWLVRDAAKAREELAAGPAWMRNQVADTVARMDAGRFQAPAPEQMVEVVARAMMLNQHPHINWEKQNEWERGPWTKQGRVAIAALQSAGHLVPPGHVAVPVDDLRRVLFLARGGNGDLSNHAMSAIERLEGIVQAAAPKDHPHG